MKQYKVTWKGEITGTSTVVANNETEAMDKIQRGYDENPQLYQKGVWLMFNHIEIEKDIEE